MKKINLTLIFIIISTQIISAQGSNHDNKVEGARTEYEYQKLGLLKNTDNFNFSRSLDTSILKYKSFLVKKRGIDTYEEILIYSGSKRVAINYSFGYYFLGLVNDRFAIFDEGTSNTRRLMIYDLHEEKELINIVYLSELVLKNNSIHFKSEVKIVDEKLKPKCPPDIEVLSYKIYLEEQYFDFQKLEVIHTGNYICSFIE